MIFNIISNIAYGSSSRFIKNLTIPFDIQIISSLAAKLVKTTVTILGAGREGLISASKSKQD